MKLTIELEIVRLIEVLLMWSTPHSGFGYKLED
jgi:hypothetical protein